MHRLQQIGSSEVIPRPRPALGPALAVWAALIATVLGLRLGVLGGLFVPVADALPLMVCLWTRRRWMLWTMASIFALITVIKSIVIIPHDVITPNFYQWLTAGVMFAYTWAVAAIVHFWINARERLEQRNIALAEANEELAAGNEELACREEEIRSQNEELARQTEEMRQLNEELSDRQSELDARRREAEEASTRKTRFLAAVSHDVRTPANAINLMAELISRSSRDPAMYQEIPELAGDLQSNARSLVELVSDVLDLARFDSGKLDLQERTFALGPLIEAETRQLLPLAQAKGLKLWSGPVCERLWLHTDRIKLGRVIANLIGNAIKFTEQGEVKVECGTLEDGRVQVQVIDTGMGIAPESLAKIFDEFYQLRNPERDRSKGVGLGLAICKRLVGAMGGTINVRSEIGKGSVFSVVLPARIVMPAGDRDIAQPAPQPPAPAGELAGLRILLVEDHPATRRATARLLREEGAVVAEAEMGRDALRMLNHESPQVVLLDLMLPDMDGSEILRQLQQHRPEQLRAVLVVSGDVTAARMDEIASLGADGMLAKPIDVNQLVRALRTGVTNGATAV